MHLLLVRIRSTRKMQFPLQLLYDKHLYEYAMCLNAFTPAFTPDACARRVRADRGLPRGDGRCERSVRSASRCAAWALLCRAC